jgi:DNA-binding NarL/FixJ family response regulator
MGMEEAVEYALPEEKPSTAILSSTSKHPGGLTSREVEVLELVAKGLTNFEVAQRLFISPRTIDTHLTSIYHKLGVSSRAAASRFALDHGLA